MGKLETTRWKRPENLSIPEKGEPLVGVLYARSYLFIRVIIGFVGIGLPAALWLLEGSPLLKAGWRVRGSLSAYYHSGARDIFVGALAVIGFFLITYMAGHRRSRQYWLSTIAGVAAIGVALFPTSRPGLEEKGCQHASSPPLECTALQEGMGEPLLTGIHYGWAAIFILALARLAFVFAETETEAHARFAKRCGKAMVVGLVVAVVGFFVDWRGSELKVGGFTPLYLAEVICVLGFAASWIHKARDLLGEIGERLSPLTRVLGPSSRA